MVFAVLVTLAVAGTKIAVGTLSVPTMVGGAALSHLFVLALVGLFVAPAALHLTAALQTVLLIVIVPDRAGVSETVQIIGYATAPCVFAGIPIPTVQAVCTAYGALLLFVGIREVHGTSFVRATIAGALPAVAVFGFGFGGNEAWAVVVPQLASASESLLTSSAVLFRGSVVIKGGAS
jgi:hypothetical protein